MNSMIRFLNSTFESRLLCFNISADEYAKPEGWMSDLVDSVKGQEFTILASYRYKLTDAHFEKLVQVYVELVEAPVIDKCKFNEDGDCIRFRFDRSLNREIGESAAAHQKRVNAYEQRVEYYTEEIMEMYRQKKAA